MTEDLVLQLVFDYLYYGRVKVSHPDINVLFDWVLKISCLSACFLLPAGWPILGVWRLIFILAISAMEDSVLELILVSLYNR